MTSRLASAKLIKVPVHAGRGVGGGVAGVDIGRFPQLLYTRTIGDPDTLFVPLLDAAREGCQMVERLCSQGEEREMAVTLSSMQLAASFLKDPSFTVVSKGPSHENLYSVDLEAGTLDLSTRLFAAISQRTSFFKIEIAGKILDGQFVVQNPIQKVVILQVSEEELRRAGFFSTILAPQCLRAQMDQERFGRLSEAPNSALPSLDVHGEARFTLQVPGGQTQVALRRKEKGGRWDIVDCRAQEWVGALSPELERPLEQVIQYLQELFGER
jgi:hypothetical protein